jgi:hypothetical protein
MTYCPAVVRAARGIVVVEEAVANLDGKFAMPLHRIARIDRKIKNRVLDLGNIDERIP